MSSCFRALAAFAFLGVAWYVGGPNIREDPCKLSINRRTKSEKKLINVDPLFFALQDQGIVEGQARWAAEKAAAKAAKKAEKAKKAKK
jgi:hypothetical protein